MIGAASGETASALHGRSGSGSAGADDPGSHMLLTADRNRIAPIILTPYGVAAVLLFMAAREGDGGFVLKVLGALAAVMALNLAMLLNAGRVLRVFGASPVRVAGWVFAVLLAVLAVQAVVEPVRAYVADLRATQSDFDDDGVYENALFTPRHAAHRLSDRPNHGVIADRSGRRPD